MLLLLSIGLTAYVQAIVSASISNRVTQESAMATRAARSAMEVLKGTEFSEAFASFNRLEADDPGGAGTALGGLFAVEGLDPTADDADGFVGEIVFPVDPAAPGVLREDLDLPELGMPRDLNGDGVVDGADHSGDYRILPVLVRLEWRGRATTARLSYKTLLTEF